MVMQPDNHVDNLLTNQTILSAYLGLIKPTDPIQKHRFSDDLGETLLKIFNSDKYSRSFKAALCLDFSMPSPSQKWMVDNGTNVELYLFFNILINMNSYHVVTDTGHVPLEDYAIKAYIKDPTRFTSIDGSPNRSAIYAWTHNPRGETTLKDLIMNLPENHDEVLEEMFALTVSELDSSPGGYDFEAFLLETTLKQLHEKLPLYKDYPLSWVKEILTPPARPNVIIGIEKDQTITLN